MGEVDKKVKFLVHLSFSKILKKAKNSYIRGIIEVPYIF